MNTIREAEIKPSLNTGHITSDRKPIYSRNFSAAVAIVEMYCSLWEKKCRVIFHWLTPGVQ